MPRARLGVSMEEATRCNVMQAKPLVSVVIPTYNRKHFVADAIDSCRSQTYGNIEIIVVDDGSADGTSHFLREQYGDSIRLLVGSNQGPAIARNRGLEAARGDFIHFLDADDRLHEEKIALGIDAFQRFPDVSVLYTHFQFVASDGRTPVETPAFERFSDDIFCELLRQTGCRILTSSSMFRAAALRDVGGFADDREFRSAEDWDLFLRLAERFKFHAIDRRLVYRRMHGDMISDDRLRGALGRLKTVQNARHYGWQRCMDEGEFKRKESARHHVYAVYLWDEGDRQAARKHFLRAADLYRPEAHKRRLYALYTFLLPPAAIDWTAGLARRLRRLR